MLAIAGIAILTLRRWSILGPFPPGLDGAQWLALGRGLRGFGRSTDGAYAPLVPLLAGAMDALIGPLPTVRLLAMVSGLAVSLAVWFVARDLLGSFWGLAVAALVIPASALAEPLFYGGYPQQLSFAAGIVALWASCRFLLSGGYRMLTLSGLAALIAAGAHHIYFPLLALSIAVAVAFRLSDSRAMCRVSRTRSLALALIPSFTLFAVIALRFLAAGYAAPISASARLPADAWVYGTREAPVTWLLLLGCGVASLAALWRSRAEPAWLVSVSLILPAGLLFGFAGQPRLLPPLIVGTGIATGLGASHLARRGNPARPAIAILAVVVAAALVVPADRMTARFAGFYEVVDAPLVRAATAIAADDASGVVAVRQDRRGWPVGWWFEALLDRPVVVGSDPQWLAFPEEVEHARLAAALFDGALDGETFLDRANASGVRYLVTPKWDWIGWERWTSTAGFPVTVLYDDDRYLVLRVT